MHIIKISFFILLSLSSFIFSCESFAWSNYFKFVNNFNSPFLVSITPQLATVSNLCSDKIKNVEVAPHSMSCEFKFDVAPENSFEFYKNVGNITISKKNDPKSYCIYNYNYTYTYAPYSYSNLRSENISLQSCTGLLKPNEISVINDHTQALPRPLSELIAPQLAESLSYADCGGSVNNWYNYLTLSNTRTIYI